MANFFYIDAVGQKQGPVNDQQLKALVNQGAVKPNTPLETDSGHKGLAGQIPGLFGPASPIQPTTPSGGNAPPAPPVAASVRERVVVAVAKSTEWGKEAYQKAKPHVSAAASAAAGKIQSMVSPPVPPETEETSDDFSGSSAARSCKMNYKRNKFYFDPIPAKDAGMSLPALVFAIICSLGGFALLVAGAVEREYAPAVWGGILMGVGAFIMVSVIQANKKIADYNKNRIVVTDAEIDRACAECIKNLKSTALKKLGIEEEQIKDTADPIQFADYYYRKISAPVRYKLGDDGILRTSNYNAVIFFFSADQIYCYCFRFSLLKDEKQEITDECFYGDIVSVATLYEAVTSDVVTEIIPGKTQAEQIGRKVGELIGGVQGKAIGTVAGAVASVIKEKKTDYFGSFKLTTSGQTEMMATFSNIETVERSINGMRNLLRDKKRHLERYDTK